MTHDTERLFGLLDLVEQADVLGLKFRNGDLVHYPLAEPN
jgi:hypothetical protein